MVKVKPEPSETDLEIAGKGGESGQHRREALGLAIRVVPSKSPF